MGEQQMALNGKVAIVTGAAQGIGIPVARRFLQDGFSVMVADNNDERGAAAVTELSSLGEVRCISTELLNELTSIHGERRSRLSRIIRSQLTSWSARAAILS
jgi:NAD(P)-dependent dehydrogenase (short-subunit alcohol dehydrogenase family)